MNKQNIKVIVTTSIFWILLAGVVILVQNVDKQSYSRGYADGFTKAKVILSQPAQK